MLLMRGRLNTLAHPLAIDWRSDDSIFRKAQYITPSRILQCVVVEWHGPENDAKRLYLGPASLGGERYQ